MEEVVSNHPCKFIEELTEARLFRYESELKGKSVSELAKILFLNLLMLEILRIVDPYYVQKYSKDTFHYGSFKGIRSYATDLHNLIAALTDWEVRIRLSNDNGISVPMMALKRYFQELAIGNRGPVQQSQDRSLFYQLQSDLRVQEGVVSHVRRALTNLYDIEPNELMDMAERISRMLDSMGTFTDVHWHYKQSARHKVIKFGWKNN